MLEVLYNVALKTNIFCDKSHKPSNIINEIDLYKSVFYEKKQSFLREEIEFINISTEERKNDDKNIIYSNFLINNLLHFLNKKDKDLDINDLNNTERKNIQKKKIEKHKNILLDNFFLLKKIKIDKIKKNKNQLQLLNLRSQSHTWEKNKSLYDQENKLNNINIKNILHTIKLHHERNYEQINFYNANNNDVKNIRNEKHVIFFTDFQNHKKSLFPSKNINHIDNSLRNTNSIKDTDQLKLLKFKREPLFFYNSENSIKWKKLVNQKILLSISNKDNQAEIYLKPENLGSIYIKIIMQDDGVKLSFISNHNEIRTFLDNHLNFLRDSLKKNGIKLLKANISSSLKSKEVDSSENYFYKNVFDSTKIKKRCNLYKKNTEILKHQFIDIYV